MIRFKVFDLDDQEEDKCISFHGPEVVKKFKYNTRKDLLEDVADFCSAKQDKVLSITPDRQDGEVLSYIVWYVG